MIYSIIIRTFLNSFESDVRSLRAVLSVKYLHRGFERAFMCPYGYADSDVSAASDCSPDGWITISLQP